MTKSIFDYVGWMFFIAVVGGALFYNMLSRSSVRKLRTAVLYGVVTGVMTSFAMISAVFPVWLAVVSLLVTIAVIVWSMARWREATLADRRSLRLRSAVCATGLNLLLLWPMTRAFDAFRRGIPVVGVFQTQIAAIIAISAICFVWRTYFKRKRYRRRWILTDIVWGFLVVFAIISLLVSAVKAAPRSKSAKTKAAVETVGQGPIDAIKELLGKLLDSSDDEVVPDDESSVAAEVAEESVVAEVEADAKAETDDEAEVVEVKWGTYEKVIKDHPEFTIYNFPLTTDDDPDNNSYFGPNIYDSAKTATEYWKTIKEMMEKDPFILAESIATADEARHTDLCGAYYNGDDAEWAEVINLMIEDFFNQPGSFVNLSERFINMLNNETRELQLVHLDNVQDQYFLDIYTRKGIPRLVVCETHQSGDILIAWTRTKGGPENDVGLGFRLQCCNVCAVFLRDGTVIPVSEEMKIPVEKVPEMPKGYDPPAPKKAPTPSPKPEPTATPTPVPGEGSDPAKDPGKAPKKNTERNDDPGAGKETNNGSGSQTSAAQSESAKASDSGSMEDYDYAIEQNYAANDDGGSSGGESYDSYEEPTYFEDNNEGSGNGGASIDTPTEDVAPATVAETGQKIDETIGGTLNSVPD